MASTMLASMPTIPAMSAPVAAGLLVLSILATMVILLAHSNLKFESPMLSAIQTYSKFAWNCFVKPHTKGESGSQQDALESFYSAQASIYDATRTRLLRGREDMLALVAAQMRARVNTGTVPAKPVWVDIGGGTGYNIEAMNRFVEVSTFFGHVFVVDFSPSLCKVARDRFERLGWKNVTVVCQDARHFKLEDHEGVLPSGLGSPRATIDGKNKKRAELITMSYSLSMIPEYYPVIDSISSLLAPNGVIGVADFYVQSEVDYHRRNYIGGEINRHCMWISRVFWRTWFEADRVNLEAARRDYLEYRFGTIVSINQRCHLLGFRIPYYVWMGVAKDSSSVQLRLAKVNASATESPFISALDLQSRAAEESQRISTNQFRSKAYDSAIVNLAASLPLPSAWYQTHHWRIYYDETLQKHRQFNDEYIYAFTWEDDKADERILNINEDDVILAITSAGDNILSYATQRPKRIHAVDLNPSQNHLLELKVASFTALDYSDVWKLFGEGRHDNFRDILISKLSPHLSSYAFQYWLEHGPAAFSGKGFYNTGGSRHALQLAQWLFWIVNLKDHVDRFCSSQTMNEQRELWAKSIRKVLLSRFLAWTIIGNKAWLWKALGVPNAQREMIEADYIRQSRDNDVPNPRDSPSSSPIRAAELTNSTGNPASGPKPLAPSLTDTASFGSGRAIWEYAVNTLDPVAASSSISSENHYYLLCLLGHYTRRCHPTYLTPRSHTKLSKPDAFDGRISIHTDELQEVLERMAPDTLTIAVVMDSMDWFDPGSDAAAVQIGKINRALKTGGRVMLRSAGLYPWYIATFEQMGFKGKRVACRMPGSCIDRVNMYASTWVLTKFANVDANGVVMAQDIKTMQEIVMSPTMRSRSRPSSLEPLDLGHAIMEE